MSNIFISYAREDHEVALSIYKLLKNAGFSPWLDTVDLLPGKNWEEEIDKVIHNSSIFIACLSSHAISKRGYVQVELKKALQVLDTIPEDRVFLIPVRLDACSVPNKLSKFHYIDYWHSHSSDKLITAISTYIAEDSNRQINPSNRQEGNSKPSVTEISSNPTILFEDSLIQFYPDENSSTIYYLTDPSYQSSCKYLYPFKKIILDYYSPEDIANNTLITQNTNSGSLQVTFRSPLNKWPKIEISKEYNHDNIILGSFTNELAAWPDFTSETWDSYFYIKTRVAASDPEIEFEPSVEAVSQNKLNHTWYFTHKPADAFVGTITGKSGLLLIRHNKLMSPNKYWRVSLDLGDTHVRAFMLEVTKIGGGYEAIQNKTIQTIQFTTRAIPLTHLNPTDSACNFFTLKDKADPPIMGELMNLLIIPGTTGKRIDEWLPCKGFITTHWRIEDWVNPENVRRNLKWSIRDDNSPLQSFMRCLLLMIQVEAFSQGARVISVNYSYPSHTENIIASHNAAWKNLQSYIDSGQLSGLSGIEIRDGKCSELMAVCRHLIVEQDASDSSNNVVLNLGDNTSEIAILADGRICIAESVKMTQRVLNQFLQSADSIRFLKWLEGTLQRAPYNLRNFSLERFASKPEGYSSMFNDLLRFVDLKRYSDILVDQILSAPESRRLISHLIFLFSGLLYYAGLLARKTSQSNFSDAYHIYFCGEGGTLIKWIPDYKEIAREMFVIGMHGSLDRMDTRTPNVAASVSYYPKNEIGRGLLAEYIAQSNATVEYTDLVNLRGFSNSVTVGDTNYEGVQWNDELNQRTFLNLPEGTVPSIQELIELNTFIEAFKQGHGTKEAAKELGIETVNEDQFRIRLLQRLFGATKGCVIFDIKSKDYNSSIESLLITEIKCLLETATQNFKLFD